MYQNEAHQRIESRLSAYQSWSRLRPVSSQGDAFLTDSVVGACFTAPVPKGSKGCCGWRNVKVLVLAVINWVPRERIQCAPASRILKPSCACLAYQVYIAEFLLRPVDGCSGVPPPIFQHAERSCQVSVVEASVLKSQFE